MRTTLLGVLSFVLAGSSQAQAQPPAATISAPGLPAGPPAPGGFVPVPVGEAPGFAPQFTDEGASPSTPYVWASAEYLLWWVKSAPLPVPLVTTGDPNVGFPIANTAGAIGQPGTQVLYGGSGVNFGPLSGMRFTLGGWLNPEQTLGLEGSAFLLETRTNRFSAASDATGNPPLYVPAFNVLAGEERGLPIADPLRGFAGSIQVSSALQLWGAEANAALSLWRQGGLQVSMLTGFRYLDLRENLQINASITDLIFLNTTTANDLFATRNQFYGGQVGSRLTWQGERLFVNLTGKVALGSTHEVVNIQGNITQTPLPGGFSPNPGTFPGGLFAQSSNIGRRTANEFAVLPSVDLKFGYQITSWLTGFVGYDFLYLSRVVRPGDQIDRNINPSQNTVLGTGVLAGPAVPAPQFNRSDFFAHGVSFGLGIRY